MDRSGRLVRWLEKMTVDDIPVVGGKNASLGEMLRTLGSTGIRVPNGFATTAHAYWVFIESNNLKASIEENINSWKAGKISLQNAVTCVARAG